MLSPCFREGTQLSQKRFVELELPEDDAGSMTTIFRIAHLQNRFVPQSIPITTLLEISHLCDKYDLKETLEMHIKV